MLYHLAANRGYGDAQNRLGAMHQSGEGVTQDSKEAIRWYRLAADRGHARAQYNLGLMYHEGQGVVQDYKEALKWYRFAADQGHVLAQYNLGAMYANGQGVTASPVIALALLTLSAANSSSADKNATDNRTRLTKNMSSQDMQAAQELMRELSRPNSLVTALDQYIKKHPATP